MSYPRVSWIDAEGAPRKGIVLSYLYSPLDQQVHAVITSRGKFVTYPIRDLNLEGWTDE